MSAPNALPPPSLSVDDLAVSRGGRTLFSGLGFELAAGSALTLKGPNGAGKTSLLLALAGAIRPQTGTIVLRAGGETLDIAPQIHLLTIRNAVKPRLTIAENLAFWRAVNGPGDTAVAAALARVGLGGLEHIEAGHLSTGQQRRLALARLLVSARRIWLLDEPSASLDSAGETLVSALVGAHVEAGGIAVIATHHELNLPAGAAAPREIVFREGGAVVIGGRPAGAAP